MSGCFDAAWSVIKIDSDEERIRYMADAADVMYGPHKQRTMHDFGLPLDPDFERTYESDALRGFQLDKRRNTKGQGFAMYAKDRRNKERASKLGLHDFDNVRIEPFIARKPRYRFGRPIREMSQSGYALVGERDGKTHDLSIIGVGSPRELADTEARQHITDIYGQTNPALRRRNAYKKIMMGLINAGYGITSDDRNPYSNPFHQKLIANLPEDFSASVRRGRHQQGRQSPGEEARFNEDIHAGVTPLSSLNRITYHNEAHPLAVNFFDSHPRPAEFGDLRMNDPVGIPVMIPQSTYETARGTNVRGKRIPDENTPQKVQSYFPSAMVGVNRERDINTPMPTKPWRDDSE